VARVVLVLGHLSVFCEGVLCLPRWNAKDNSSKLLVSLSYLTCGLAVLLGSLALDCQLATEPRSGGRHNGDVACWQACKPREKNYVTFVIDFLDFSQ
jgi:hypothetical protein